MKGKTLGAIVLGAAAFYYTSKLVENQRDLSHELEPLRQEILLEINNKIEEKGKEARFDFNYDGKIEAINNTVKEFYRDNNMRPLRGGWGTTTKSHDITQVPVAPIPLQLNPLKWGDKDASAVKTYFRQKYGNNYQAHMNYGSRK